MAVIRGTALSRFSPIKSLLLTIFLIGHYAADVKTCSCGQPGNATETFCDAKWVSRVQILSKTTMNVKRNWLKYTVRPIEVFKLPPSLKTFPDHVYTAPQSATCGVTDLEPKTEYLLAGSLTMDKEPYIHICTVFVDDAAENFSASPPQWRNVSASLQQILRTHNLAACESLLAAVVVA